MAKIKYQDKELEVADDWRIGELVEAENALDMDMTTAKGGAQMALMVFITIRRHDKQTPAGVLADQVMRLEVRDLEMGADEPDEEANPFEPDPVEHSGITEPLTTGVPRSGS